jgi:hypothetical protein
MLSISARRSLASISHSGKGPSGVAVGLTDIVTLLWHAELAVAGNSLTCMLAAVDAPSSSGPPMKDPMGCVATPDEVATTRNSTVALRATTASSPVT